MLKSGTSTAPHAALVSVPVAGWTGLLTVDVVMLSLDQTIAVGLHGVAIGLNVAATIVAATIWACQRVIASTRAQLALNDQHLSQAYGALSLRIMDLRDALEAPTQPLPVLVGSRVGKLDPKVVELGTRIAMRITEP